MTIGMKSDLDTVRIFTNLPVVTNNAKHPVGTSLQFVKILQLLQDIVNYSLFRMVFLSTVKHLLLRFFRTSTVQVGYSLLSTKTMTIRMKSDLYTVRILTNLHVVTDNSKHSVGTSLLFIQDSTTLAGYCKLQLVQDGVPHYGEAIAAEVFADIYCTGWLQFTINKDNDYWDEV